MANKLVDYKGLKCPMPIFKLGKEIKDMVVGDILEVTSDDQAFKPDIEAFCKFRKMELVSLTNEEGIIVAQIKKL